MILDFTNKQFKYLQKRIQDIIDCSEWLLVYKGNNTVNHIGRNIKDLSWEFHKWFYAQQYEDNEPISVGIKFIDMLNYERSKLDKYDNERLEKIDREIANAIYDIHIVIKAQRRIYES